MPTGRIVWRLETWIRVCGSPQEVRSSKEDFRVGIVAFGGREIVLFRELKSLESFEVG